MYVTKKVNKHTVERTILLHFSRPHHQSVVATFLKHCLCL